MYSWLIAPHLCHTCDDPHSLRWICSLLIYFQCMCWLHILAEVFSPRLLCSLWSSTFYLFSPCLTYCALTSNHWFGRKMKTVKKSSRRLWRCCQPSSPHSVTAGQAEEVGQLLIETGSRSPIADGPRASQCGY